MFYFLYHNYDPKGVAFPELIEAWLKYGVITKEELTENGIEI